MSHALTLSATDLENLGVPVVRNLEALRRACVIMSIPVPVYTKDYDLEGKRVSGQMVRLKGWINPVIYDLENGTAHFDNYPLVNEDHPDVKSGKRRIGEEGRWGEFQEMLNLETAYTQAATQVMADQIIEEANESGEMCQIVSQTSDRIELLITN